MHRFYLPPDSCLDRELALRGAEAHHAATVFRLKAGDRLIVLDGVGHELLCEIRWIEAGEVGLSLLQRTAAPPLDYQVTLMQAVPKGKVFEEIVQKAAELCTYRIIPVLSDRSIPQFEEADWPKKIKKWRAVAIEAMKQCGSPWLPVIDPPSRPQAILGRGEPADLKLIASLHPRTPHPRKHFENFRADHERKPRSVFIWIGPEGDFTPAEINLIQAAGALPITLGRVILRSDTAAIYALSVVNYELQNSGAAS